MITPDFSPVPDSLFNVAIINVTKMSWREFMEKTNSEMTWGLLQWKEVMPYPEQTDAELPYFVESVSVHDQKRKLFDPEFNAANKEGTYKRTKKKFYPEIRFGSQIPMQLKGQELETAQRKEWEKQATKFVVDCRERIDEQINSLTYYTAKSLRIHENDRKKTILLLDSATLCNQWLNKSADMSLKDFCMMSVSIKTVSAFVSGKVDTWMRDCAIPSPTVDTQAGLIDTPAADEGLPKKKRGTYATRKPQVINFYTQSVRDKIEKAVRENREPARTVIERQVCQSILDNEVWKISDRTLRGYLPAIERERLFGKLHRQVLELKTLYNK
jgi:hypothetical protein